MSEKIQIQIEAEAVLRQGAGLIDPAQPGVLVSVATHST